MKGTMETLSPWGGTKGDADSPSEPSFQTASPPPLDFPSLYLAEGSLHLPAFVAPFLLSETADKVVELLSLLRDPEKLRAQPGKLMHALRLLRDLQRTGTLDAVPLEHWVEIAARLARLLMGDPEAEGAAASEGSEPEETEDDDDAEEARRPAAAGARCGAAGDCDVEMQEGASGVETSEGEEPQARGRQARRDASRLWYEEELELSSGDESNAGTEDLGEDEASRRRHLRLSTSQQIRICEALEDVLDVIRPGYLPPVWMKPSAASRYAQSVTPSCAASFFLSPSPHLRRPLSPLRRPLSPLAGGARWKQSPRAPARKREAAVHEAGDASSAPARGAPGEDAEEEDWALVAESDPRASRCDAGEEAGASSPSQVTLSPPRAEAEEGEAREVERLLSPLEVLQKHLKWRWMLVQLLRRFDRSYRGQVASSAARRKALVSALMRLASASRPFWGFSPSASAEACSPSPRASATSPDATLAPPPSAAVSSWFLAHPEIREAAGRERATMAAAAVCGVFRGSLEEVLDLLARTTDFTSSRIFLRFRLVLLFAPPAFCHALVRDGRLTRWWAWADGAFASSWDALFVLLLFRASKFGWATGQPLTCALRPLLPLLFQVLLRVFQLPHSAPGAAATMKRQRETIPGEYTPLLESQFNTPCQLAKVLVLLLEPLPTMRDAGAESDGQQPAGCAGEMRKPNCEAETRQETEEKKQRHAERHGATSAFELLEALMSTLLVFTHPSSDGARGTAAIGAFLNAFISAYIRRVQRERLGDNIVREVCGRHVRGCCMGCGATAAQGRETAAGETPGEGGAVEETAPGAGGAAEGDETEGQSPHERCQCCWCRRGEHKNEETGEFFCLRLGRQEDEKVVELLGPLFLQGMFSKHMGVASCYEDGMKLLCHLQPEKVVEGLLERATASLEDVIEARHSTTVQLLTRTAQTLVKFAPAALPTILSLTLPGIDPADPLKTFLTLSFYTVLFSYIPLIDCSGISEGTKHEYQKRLRETYLQPQAFVGAASPGAATGSRFPADADLYGECAATLPEALQAAQGRRQFLNLSNFPDSFLLQSEASGTPSCSTFAPASPGAPSFASEGEPSSSASSLCVLFDGEGGRGGRAPARKEAEAAAAPGGGGEDARAERVVGLYRVREGCWQHKMFFDSEFFSTLISQREAASAFFPEWVDMWFEQVLRLVKHATEPAGKSGSPMARLDRGTNLILRACVSEVAAHVEEKTVARLVEKFLSWSETPVGEAAKQAQSLAVPLAAALPDRMLAKLVSRVCDKLLDKDATAARPPAPEAQRKAGDAGECEKEEAEVRDAQKGLPPASASPLPPPFAFPASRLKAGVSEAVIEWNVLLVCSAVRSAGTHNLRFSADLFRIAHACLQHESKAVFKLGAKLLRRVIEASLGVYPWQLCGQRCMGPREWEDVEERKKFVLRWGEPFWMQPGAEKIRWHIPSEAEAHLATQAVAYGLLVCKFLAKDALPPPATDAAARGGVSRLLSGPQLLGASVRGDWETEGEEAAPQAVGGEREEPVRRARGGLGARLAEKAWAPVDEDFQAVAYPPSFFAQPATAEASSAGSRGAAPSSSKSTAFVETCKKLSSASLIARSLLLCRALLKGTAVLYPDERPRRTRGIPLLSPFDADERMHAGDPLGSAFSAPVSSADGREGDRPNAVAAPGLREAPAAAVAPLVEFGASLILRVERVLLRRAASQAAPTELAPCLGFEEAKLQKKVLRAASQLLVRLSSSVALESLKNIRGGDGDSKGDIAGRDAIGYLSCDSGAHSFSYLYDVPRGMWTQTVTSAWARRVAARRSQHPFEGCRRAVLLLVARLAVYHYAETRRFAQHVLRDSFSVVYGARRFLAALLLRELAETCERRRLRDREKAPATSPPPLPSSLSSDTPSRASPSGSPPILASPRDWPPLSAAAASAAASPLLAPPAALVVAARIETGDGLEPGALSGTATPALSSDVECTVEAPAAVAPPGAAAALVPSSGDARRVLSDAQALSASLAASADETKVEEEAPVRSSADSGTRHASMALISATSSESSPASIASPTSEIETEDLFFAQLTGVAYTLNSDSMMRRVWSDASLAALALRTVLLVFEVKIAKDTVPQRWVALTHTLLNCRERLRRSGAAFQRDIVQGVLRPLLARLLQKPPAAARRQSLAPPPPAPAEGAAALAEIQSPFHWRFSLVATCVAVCLNGPPILEILPEYAQWILCACDSRQHPPLLNMVAMFALMLLLKYFLKHPEVPIPPNFLRALHSSSTLRKWVAAQAIIHHEGVRSLSGGTAGRRGGPAQDSSFQLVVDVIKIDRSWPSSRTSRVSKALSLHNALSAKTLFQFLFATSHLVAPAGKEAPTEESVAEKEAGGEKEAVGKEARRGESLFSLFETLKEELVALAQHPSSEPDCHISVVEIVCGAAAAARKCADDAVREALWKAMWPAMVAEYKQLDELRLLAWLDGIRFVVQRPEKNFRFPREDCAEALAPQPAASAPGAEEAPREGTERRAKRRGVPEEVQMRRILPFMNFCINASTGAPKSDDLAAFPSVDQREFASSSFELTRQLRLFGGLLVAILTESHLLGCSASSRVAPSPQAASLSNAPRCDCLCGTCASVRVIQTGLPIIHKGFSHPYKQVREEVARLISVVICLGDEDELQQVERERALLVARYCSAAPGRRRALAVADARQGQDGAQGDARRADETPCGCCISVYQRQLQDLLLGSAAALAPAIDADTGPEAGRQPGSSKSPFLCGSATILTSMFYSLLQHDAFVLAACAAGGPRALDWCLSASAAFLAKMKGAQEPQTAGSEEDAGDDEPLGVAGGPLMFLLAASKHPDRDIQGLAANVGKIVCLQPMQPQLLRDFSALQAAAQAAAGAGARGAEDAEGGVAEPREETQAGGGGASPETLLAQREEGGQRPPPMSRILREVARAPVVKQLHMLVEAFASYMRHPSWKVRCAAVRLSELLGCQYRMLLFGSETYRRLVEVGIVGLQDPQPEVQQAAKVALSFLLLSCTDQECRYYTQVFLQIAGPSTAPAAGGRPDEAARSSLAQQRSPLAGVLGLAALVHAAPFHVPGWLPETITCLAKYANAKMSDTIRRHVEKTLQEFYRTHQDAWRQLHVRKFSPEQLDVLETYKGRPTYFA
ncbi:hypothetical protein BESB_046430 [Besnoitia besnoiti]|uniref:Proteasome activator Blm10 mid region domain-containing protein n=1 Tax=Besnoitia besnoiti TaxID=94643 RepID=A0A2A9MJM4_BESBE|nr:hypothetical protein BESB_046430 [Besnoitia besnoiti]PFH36451.1 hypothetical protein BESB_046430 [Besnoitia besnoiti]